MDECKKWQEMLPAYLDRDLSSERLQGLEEHLSRCQKCAAEQEALTKSWQALETYGDIEPAPDFRARFWAEARKSPRPGFWEMLAALLRPRFAVLAAVAAVIAMLLFAWHLAGGVHVRHIARPSPVIPAPTGGTPEIDYEKNYVALSVPHPVSFAMQMPEYVEIPPTQDPDSDLGHKSMRLLDDADDLFEMMLQ